ncbi:bluetail domain-containing putative surface protein [Halovibrio sp. HP20-50]|uniref:beta strand repeat-containing protein n=1 Tax=Halovibrio sp. HP20-59 TaxID=3080275 RepID=UPI00294A9DE5|nr:bluetail domain-containing putative surface protein [Halovibrio sp. HP20-59]MEA2120072.1 bluetail domain-containing putative surface protein [Halovibrio sp. HP20-59]
MFGTANNDTFTAEAGTLQAGDSLLDQSTSDNDTLNAVITNANKGGIAPTLLNIENVNLDLDVFSGAQFSAANTDGATITASSSKQGYNGAFTLSNAGDNNVVAGENVTNLVVTALEAGTVNTGAAEKVSVTTDTSNDAANVIVNGDIALGVDNADVLNLTATADSTVTLTDVAGTGTVSVTEIVGSGEGVITVQGDLSAVTDITGVDTAVVTTTGANAAEWEVNTISIAEAIAAIEIADAANVTITEEQTGLTITGQGNTGSTVNVTSGLAALGTLAFASATLASAELELTAAGVEVASLTANDVALTVNVTDGAELAVVAGDDVTLVGSGNVVIEDADAVGTLDASGLDGELELTTTIANTAGIEVNGAVGNNTVEFANSGETNFVGQAGNDQVTFSAAFGDEATVITNAGDDTVTLEANVTGTMAINFGEGNDTLEVASGVDLSAGTLSLVGLENVVIATSATFAAEQLSGAEYSVAGDAGQAAFTVEGTANSSSIDLSGLDLNRTIDTGITGVTVDLTAGGTTVTGTSVADTIQGIDVTADYTLTLGGGADAVHSLTAGAGSVTITDFDADNDGLFSDAGAAALAADIEFGSITTAQAATFNDAATLAFANAGGTAALVGEVVSFEYEGSAYIVINDGSNAGFAAADDLVIELQGITETEVAAIA